MNLNDDIEYNYDHADYVIDNLDRNIKSYKKFVASIDTAYFISSGFDTQAKIDYVMRNMLLQLVNTILDKIESNGSNANKNGGPKPKSRIRRITFDKLLIAYHNVGIDGSVHVNPHYHFIFNSKERLGKGYSYLKNTLSEIANTFSLKFHFEESKGTNDLSQKESNSIGYMALLMQRGYHNQIFDYIYDDKISIPLSHLKQTRNHSTYFKQLGHVNRILRKYDQDYDFDGVNIKETFPFYLSSLEHGKLMALKNSEPVTLDLDLILDREILKYSHGFGSNTMDILTEHFNIPPITPHLVSYSNPSIPKKNMQTKPSKKDTFFSVISRDIRSALCLATSMSDLHNIMCTSNYREVKVGESKVNQHAKKKDKFIVTTSLYYTMHIHFKALKLDWERIQKIFAFNRCRNIQQKYIRGAIETYKKEDKSKKEELLRFDYKIKEIFRMECLFDYTLPNPKTNPLFRGFKVVRSKLYNITSYLSRDIVIVVYPDSLELKKCNDLSNGISLVLAFLEKYALKSDKRYVYYGDLTYQNEFEKRMDLPITKPPLSFDELFQKPVHRKTQHSNEVDITMDLFDDQPLAVKKNVLNDTKLSSVEKPKRSKRKRKM